MRRCFTFLLVLVAFATSSCDDKSKEQIADVIILSRSSVAFAMEGGTTSVSIASASEWEATCPDNWVTLERKDGNLSISVTGNLSEDVRDSRIAVRTANYEQQITIHQAFSRETILLSTSLSEQISFDSEGESFLFTVLTNGDWDVSCEDKWVEIEYDKSNNLVKLSAKSNPGDHRDAKVIINSAKGSHTKSFEVPVAQISRKENSYYQLLGYYGFYASNWYYGGALLGVGGTGSFCTIEEKEYRKSVYIKDLFVKGTLIEASYDKQSKTLMIELGQVCKQDEISATVTRFYVLERLNLATRTYSGGTVTGTLGKGYNEEAEQERKAILLSGLTSAYPSFGLIALESLQPLWFNDVFYATGSMYLVEWDKPASATAVTRAAKALAPSASGFSAYKH